MADYHCSTKAVGETEETEKHNTEPILTPFLSS
jgi:hypothetical protein